MADVNIWQINIGGGPNAIINLAQSVWYMNDPQTGLPFAPGQQAVNSVCSCVMQNDSTVADYIQWQLWAYPGIANQYMLESGTSTTTWTQGQNFVKVFTPIIPDDPGQTIALGVRVKAQTETTWPEWSLGLKTGSAMVFGANAMETPSWLLPVGVVAAGLLIGGYLLTKK